MPLVDCRAAGRCFSVNLRHTRKLVNDKFAAFTFPQERPYHSRLAPFTSF